MPSWDGEISGWADYSRKVRLFHSQTPASKRYTLGPKLVLRLRGKAWEVAASLDHDELSKQNGAKYLLKFLKQRLGRLPIPDVGQHLDEVFVRMRRVPGMDMISWCNLVRENYKWVFRQIPHQTAGWMSHTLAHPGVQLAGRRRFCLPPIVNLLMRPLHVMTLTDSSWMRLLMRERAVLGATMIGRAGDPLGVDGQPTGMSMTGGIDGHHHNIHRAMMMPRMIGMIWRPHYLRFCRKKFWVGSS